MSTQGPTYLAIFLAAYILVGTWIVCWKLNNPGLFWLVLAADLAIGFFTGIFAPALLLCWRLWFFMVAARWRPIGGLYRLPRWPRVPYMRGPGRGKRRVFNEPMPWTAGPFTH